jgi:hypothetical protein
MVGPLVLLAGGAFLGGLVGFPGGLFHHPEMNLLGHVFEPVLGPELEVPHTTEILFISLSTAIAVGGIALAWAFYGKGYREPAHWFAFNFRGFTALVRDKFRVDELYDFLFIRPLRRLAQLLFTFVDRILIDKVLVEGVGAVIDVAGRLIRYLQFGDAQRYMAVFAIGVAVLVYLVSQPPAPDQLHVVVEGRGVQIDARRPGRSSSRDLEYSFAFGDGRTETLRSPEARHSYAQPGRYKIKVTIHDRQWDTSSDVSRQVEVQ